MGKPWENHWWFQPSTHHVTIEIVDLPSYKMVIYWDFSWDLLG